MGFGFRLSVTAELMTMKRPLDYRARDGDRISATFENGNHRWELIIHSPTGTHDFKAFVFEWSQLGPDCVLTIIRE